MFRNIVGVSLFLLLSSNEFLLMIQSQVLKEETTNSSSVNCVNGEFVNGGCRCYPGWMGARCSLCGGRIRLTESEGVITDDANLSSSSNYSSDSTCLFFIEADRPDVSINLKVNVLHLECLWDYVQVFDGDSVYAHKIAAYTGNLVEEVLSNVVVVVPSNSSNETMTGNSTMNEAAGNSTMNEAAGNSTMNEAAGNSTMNEAAGNSTMNEAAGNSTMNEAAGNSTMNEAAGNSTMNEAAGNSTMNEAAGNSTVMREDRRRPLDPMHTLSSSGSILVLYFYTDSGSEGPGFNLSYWLDYKCPDKCSGRGTCNSSSGECLCPPSWTGHACETPVCLNNCSDNGQCDVSSGRCICHEGYEGMDCSVDVTRAHWSQVPFLSSSSISMDLLPRAGHSAVVMNSYMLVYSGYRFSGGRSNPYTSVREEVNIDAASFNAEGELLRYDMMSDKWEVLNTSSSLSDERAGHPRVDNGMEGGSGVWNVTDENSTESRPGFPGPRYGHSAVIYDFSMFVFGGSLFPSEDFTNELWELDLVLWEWLPLFNRTTPTSVISLPVPVRDHTAHVVGSKMVVLYGLSSLSTAFFSLVQEYDLISGTWSLPLLSGAANGLRGRAGHSSVYSDADGLIYIYGGRGSDGLLDHLLSYHPDMHIFSTLTPSGSPRYLHSLSILGPLLLSFGGCLNTRDCFSSDLEVYNMVCNTWQKLELPGLLANDSRTKHSTVLDPEDSSLLVFGGFVGTLRADMLRLSHGNCSQWGSSDDCGEEGGPLCVWEEEKERCVPVSQSTINNSTYSCALNSCLSVSSCSDCLTSVNCTYSMCESLQDQETKLDCPESPSVHDCILIRDCQSCRLLGCSWEGSTGSCFPPSSLSNALITSCGDDSCFLRNGCDQCLATSSLCFWCPSLSRCLPRTNEVYPSTFPFGQCLGWVAHQGSCARESCQDHSNCSSCQTLLHCGWCNDPSDTGLGVCIPGGFQAPVGNLSVCQVGEQESNETEEVLGDWQFDVCSACQCNGHSMCRNGSSQCIECSDNTTGSSCENCAPGGFGDPRNGGPCTECDCNGYNDECDISSGVCQCRTQGVSGDFCTNCTGDYGFGESDNFCYARLRAGFIYTYQVQEDFLDQGFYAITPTLNVDLDFTFELMDGEAPVIIELFLGRASEDLWVLVRITDPVIVEVKGGFQRTYGDFSYSNETESRSRLTSFARPSIRDLDNFTRLWESVNGNNYTRSVWDRDVTLVLRVYDLTNSTKIRITVDQQNYFFLLYFFATFVTCFSLLLTIFLVAWYIKRKLAYRSFVRQQYIELQRRVARPFAKVMLLLDRQPAAKVLEQRKEQYPSYVGVETCKDQKAAVLSLFVRLPGDHETGLPSLGRTGLCLGSTMVHVANKKPKTGGARQRKKQETESRRERRGGEERGRLLSNEETVVRNGRGGQEMESSAAAESV